MTTNSPNPTANVTVTPMIPATPVESRSFSMPSVE